MTIVRATIAHLADAQLLLHEYYEAIGVIKRDAPAEICSFLSDPASALWIAYRDELPAGCVVLRPLPEVDKAVECKRLYVRPQFRGQGIADQLLDALEAYTRASHLAWIYLDSKDDLRDALRIYLKRGYQECPRYNDNPQATLFLRKRLTA